MEKNIDKTSKFLEGSFGQDILKEYSDIVEKDYNGIPALNVLFYEDGVVKGTNSFAVVLINQIVAKKGLRTANLLDLRRIIKTKELDLKDHYEEFGLALRTDDEPNEYLAKDLTSKIKAKNPDAKMPAMILSSELELILDSNSPYKLGFKLKDSARIFYNLPVLNAEWYYSSDDINDETGLPDFIGGNGDHYLETGHLESGLTRIYIDQTGSINTRGDSLSHYNKDGRIVIIDPRFHPLASKLFYEKSELN
jgi:hypothetical protein